MATLRVKFTLMKLQEDHSKNRARDKLLRLTKLQRMSKQKHFHFKICVGQANRKPRPYKTHLNYNSSGSQLYGTFHKFRTTSTFSLKDERVLPSILLSLSRTSQLKNYKVMPHLNINP